MTNKKEITAGIIIIGNEVLSGRTKDINTSTLAIWLSSIGIEVKEVRVIPDVQSVIVETVNSLRKQFTYIFTTGGIGPTHDDITAVSISKAFDAEYGFHPEAYSILEKYYKPGEFNEGRQKMSKMPTNAKLILNPTSGAPGFYSENVFCLPGVPSILKSMIGGLNNVLVGGIFKDELIYNGGDTIISKSISFCQNHFYINDNFQIKLEKNIPVSGGLGGGSANSASIIRYFLSKQRSRKKDVTNKLIKLSDKIASEF